MNIVEETYEQQMKDSEMIFKQITNANFDTFNEASNAMCFLYIPDRSISRAGISHAIKRIEKYFQERKNKMEPKTYRLSDFKKEDIEKAKELLKTALKGWLKVSLDEKANQFISNISKCGFLPEDSFTLTIDVTTVGADILTAIGCAINEREEKEIKKECECCNKILPDNSFDCCPECCELLRQAMKTGGDTLIECPETPVLSDEERKIISKIRETPLLERLEICKKAIGDMVIQGRQPKISIPVQWDDEDMFIIQTIEDAKDIIEDAKNFIGEN